MTSSPDQPHDAMEAAREALRNLGHVPGPEPIRQLRQIAVDELQDIRASDGTASDAGSGEPVHVRLLEAAATGLGVLTETELDEMEQAAIVEAFGLDQKDGGLS
ncbi:hypothetical protein ABZU94_07265 [Streptomyces mirabilis]|uniref:hypothetical protein n=1 Tax=Streptomyces sp. NPDC005388 TaxID=3156717 RepID=UPI0033B25512